MKKLLLLFLVVLLGLIGAVWYHQAAPHALPASTNVPVIHKSENPAFAHKRVQAVHTATLHHRPQQLL